MAYGVMAKLAQWRRPEPEWMSHRRTKVVGLWLLLACFLLAFGIVATAIGATFIH